MKRTMAIKMTSEMKTDPVMAKNLDSSRRIEKIQVLMQSVGILILCLMGIPAVGQVLYDINPKSP